MDGKFRISVVYYRSGYTPRDYGEEGLEWRAREMMEYSTAIKCPSIGVHLIGSKHFQTVFNRKEVLLRYLNEEEAQELLAVFVGLHSLQNDDGDDDGETQNVIKDAVENYKNYVLKPQREGGGNNVYGEDIPVMLKKLADDEQLAGYILMERI